MNEELKPCPFCGGKAKLQITDDEGNFHDEEYEKNPWSGLGYVIMHNIDEDYDCPIAKYEDESMGIYIYGSKEEAIKTWNRRCKDE